MGVYHHVLTADSAGEGYRRIFEIENPEHEELSDISQYVSKCFAILHVKFGYDMAVTHFNSALQRILEIYDFNFCELDDSITGDTLFLVTVLVVSGYEEVFLRELVKYVIKDSSVGGFHLRDEYKF